MHSSSEPIDQQAPAVLVIEEDEETRRRIAEGLRSRDYRAIEAANGATGLRLLEESRSMSVIVVDLVLPRMSGWDFRRRQLRTRFATVPTIVISPQPLHPNDLDMLRAAEVVEKPLDIEQLLATVSRLSSPAATQPALFWSNRGEVACADHAPDRGSARWTEERWCATSQFGRRQLTYQCQHCAASGSPIARAARAQLAESETEGPD